MFAGNYSAISYVKMIILLLELCHIDGTCENREANGKVSPLFLVVFF